MVYGLWFNTNGFMIYSYWFMVYVLSLMVSMVYSWQVNMVYIMLMVTNYLWKKIMRGPATTVSIRTLIALSLENRIFVRVKIVPLKLASSNMQKKISVTISQLPKMSPLLKCKHLIVKQHTFEKLLSKQQICIAQIFWRQWATLKVQLFDN